MVRSRNLTFLYSLTRSLCGGFPSRIPDWERLGRRLKQLKSVIRIRTIRKWCITIIAVIPQRVWNRLTSVLMSQVIKHLPPRIEAGRPRLGRDRTIPIHVPVGHKVDTGPNAVQRFLLHGLAVSAPRKNTVEDLIGSLSSEYQTRARETLEQYRSIGMSDEDIFCLIEADVSTFTLPPELNLLGDPELFWDSD